MGVAPPSTQPASLIVRLALIINGVAVLHHPIQRATGRSGCPLLTLFCPFAGPPLIARTNQHLLHLCCASLVRVETGSQFKPWTHPRLVVCRPLCCGMLVMAVDVMMAMMTAAMMMTMMLIIVGYFFHGTFISSPMVRQPSPHARTVGPLTDFLSINGTMLCTPNPYPHLPQLGPTCPNSSVGLLTHSFHATTHLQVCYPHYTVIHTQSPPSSSPRSRPHLPCQVF